MILVTGSSGFLGSHVVEAAARRGNSVIGVDRISPERVQAAQFYSLDYRLLGERQLDGVDTLIHFAGYTSLSGFADEMKQNYSNNVLGFIGLLDLARRAGVRKVVYASSSAVYTDGRGTGFREDEPIDHLRLTSHYGKSKLMDEMIAASYSDAFGMNLLGLRYFNVYGPGDERKGNLCAPVQHFVAARKKGQPIELYFDGQQAKDFIHVSDAVEMTFRLMDADAVGLYNVGTGVATTFASLAEHIGGPVEFKAHPSPFGYQFYTRADITKLTAAIGPYKFKTVQNGIDEMMQAA